MKFPSLDNGSDLKHHIILSVAITMMMLIVSYHVMEEKFLGFKDRSK